METSYQIEKNKALEAFNNTFTEEDNRYSHTLGVVKKALSLAEKYNVDKDKVYIAAILHDICKYYDINDAKKYLNEEELAECEANEAYYHAYLASKYYLRNIGNDKEIADAIKYHVNGNDHLTKLQEIVLISDYIEDGRTYETCIYARNLVDKGLFYTAIYYSTLKTYEVVIKRGQKPGKYLEEVLVKYKEKMMTEKLQLLKEACDKVNASDIKCYNTALTSPFFDYNICASVTSNRQLNAIKSYVLEYFKDTPYSIRNVEGEDTDWVLVDCYDVILNIFTEAERQRVDLDRLFENNEQVEL